MKRIKLTQCKYALVDDEDFEWLNKFNWYATKGRNEDIWYAGRGRPISRMHREIMNAPADKQVDHKDGNGLNNQKSNLRLATNQQNQRNQKPRNSSSKFKGVHWYKRDQVWIAYIQINGELKRLGYFNSEILAAQTYNLAAKMYFGEFARLNDI